MRNKGFTLIELVISLFIITVAVSGAFAILQKVVASTTLSESNLIASFLAQEGLEIVKNIRDANWLIGSPPYNNWNNGLDGCAASDNKFCEGDYTDLTALHSFIAGTALLRPLKISSGGFYAYDDPGTDTKFKRKINIDSISGVEGVKVKVLVQWQDFGINYEFSAQSELYNWYR